MPKPEMASGIDGYANTVWGMPTMQAVASQYGWAVGGDIACCVEFAWVQDGVIYTHNFGAQLYNWERLLRHRPDGEGLQPAVIIVGPRRAHDDVHGTTDDTPRAGTRTAPGARSMW